MKRKRAASDHGDAENDVYTSSRVLRRPSIARAKEIDASPTPYPRLKAALSQQADVRCRSVLHWFRRDLRQQDNRALEAASQKAVEEGVPLITAYLYTPKEEEWHGTSPARLDFMIRSLDLLREELSEKSIPLVFLTASERRLKVSTLMKFIRDNNISHVFANFELEIDELNRDLSFLKEVQSNNVQFQLFDDQTVIAPDYSLTGQKYFTPFYQAWMKKVDKETALLQLSNEPAANCTSLRHEQPHLFVRTSLELPENKSFDSDEERDRLRTLWPAGYKAASDRLDHFLKHKIKDYKRNRSRPGEDPSSRLSVYIAHGVISVRELCVKARDNNGGKLSKCDASTKKWIRELVFREHYRQQLVKNPHNSMNLPDNLAYEGVTYEDDEEGWRKWTKAESGVPMVDAGMKQLAHEGFLHNRARMMVASYLRAALLIDYRRGERYFAEKLIDFDLANNHFGWQPSFTVLNPILQSQKCDPDGKYIKKWIPQLAKLEGKALFAPNEHLSREEIEAMGYYWPHVDHHTSRKRSLARWKEGMKSFDSEK